jgi:eukaryotic-like serine/threonine-protein kinase
MNPCPDANLLERLLTDRLADTEVERLERHVKDCVSCQQTLETLSDDRRWRAELRDEISLLYEGGLEPVVDPLGMTAGATAAANERRARAVPTVPGYEITRELGRGGMGVVYHALHIRLNRPCALKMILAGAHAGPDVVARFVTEAEAIARLEHPSIVQIRYIGDADGLPFLELEYLAGGSLDQQLDGTPWAGVRAAHLAEQVASGIAEAHRQGIVHRDLKPSNVLLAADGTPKVGDFGLAKMLDGRSALTRSESVMGSPSYMAPEQAQGHAKEAGPAVDVYAVGAILYELLTGRPPFRGTTPLETLEQVQTSEPVAPSRLVPGVARDIETICLKCLQKEPGKRFESSQALAEDLRRFLDGRPILARRISGVERAWRWCRRNRFVAGMIGAAATATVIVAIVATVAAFAFRAKDRQTQEALLESLTAQARATRFSRQMGQRFESLDALKRATRIARELELPPERFDRIRDQVIACLALPDAKPTGRIIEQPAGTIRYCFDSGMKRYALLHMSGTIVVRRVADDQEIRRVQARADRDIVIFRFSPDGRYLTANHIPGNALTVWDVDQNTVALAEPGPVAGTAPFSPDGRRIALAHPNGEVLIYDLDTKQSTKLQSGLRDIGELAFRADGLEIAVTGRVGKQPTCQILDAASGQVVRKIPIAQATFVAWSADGTTLATEGAGFQIDLWDAPSGIFKARLAGSTNNGFRAAFHPAGKLLASNGWENRLWIWDAVLGRQVIGVAAEHSVAPEFSSDGQIVLQAEGQLTTYQVDPALEYRALVHVSSEPITYRRPSIRSDNRLLAVGGETGVFLCDLARGTECAFLPIKGTWQVMFEPGGDLLTSGAAGVQRWPVHLVCEQNEFRIGPPRVLPFTQQRGQIDEDRLGRTIAVARGNHAMVLNSEGLKPVLGLNECRYVAVSPDGEWLATGSHNLGAQVWRIRDARKVAELPVDRYKDVLFSPDGRWLLTRYPPCKL